MVFPAPSPAAQAGYPDALVGQVIGSWRGMFGRLKIACFMSLIDPRIAWRSASAADRSRSLDARFISQ